MSDVSIVLTECVVSPRIRLHRTAHPPEGFTRKLRMCMEPLPPLTLIESLLRQHMERTEIQLGQLQAALSQVAESVAAIQSKPPARRQPSDTAVSGELRDTPPRVLLDASEQSPIDPLETDAPVETGYDPMRGDLLRAVGSREPVDVVDDLIASGCDVNEVDGVSLCVRSSDFYCGYS